MKRLASVIALALCIALPLGAAAKTKHMASPAPGAMAAAATMPACAASDTVVWVNTTTKIYHLPGTKYYGKTKHGMYACQSAAVKMGAKPAKMGGKSSMMTGATPSAMATPGKKHKKGGAMAMPSPTP